MSSDYVQLEGHKELGLDKYEKKSHNIDSQEEKFKEDEAKMREDARIRGREHVQNLVSKSMSKEFARLKYDPYDIKALLHPIDFVVFNGMNNDMVRDVILLSRATKNPILQSFHDGISDAVKNKSYDWTVVRVSQDGSVEFEQ